MRRAARSRGAEAGGPVGRRADYSVRMQLMYRRRGEESATGSAHCTQRNATHPLTRAAPRHSVNTVGERVHCRMSSNAAQDNTAPSGRGFENLRAAAAAAAGLHTCESPRIASGIKRISRRPLLIARIDCRSGAARIGLN